jgi:hypothetical protein
MSSYKPPASRMRQIKANAPPPLPRAAANVEEAIAEAAEAQAAGEEVADEIHVPVGIVEVVIKPGEDGVFGTDDDDVSIGARDGKHDGKHAGRDHGKDHDHEAKEPEVDDDEPLVAEEPAVEDTLDVEPVDDEPVDDEPEVEAEPDAEAEVSDDTDADEPAPFDDDDDDDHVVDDDDSTDDDDGVAADEVSEKPTYDMGMTKKTLLAIAEAHDVKIDGSKSKRNIIAALDAHFA